jgi:myo-inositol-1(or 4)-monophosphatase
LDGDWELKLETWDAAAATLIVKEAGGVVTQLDGQPYHHLNKNLLASNGLLHQAVLDVLRKSSKFYEEAREKGNQEFIFILS